MSDKTKKERMSSHHEAMAECCMNQATHSQDLADACEDEHMSKTHAAMAECWKTMASHHTAEAAGIQKSMGLGSAMQENRGFSSDGISGIIPAAPRVQAIPRHGAPDISKMEVDVQFDELLKID